MFLSVTEYVEKHLGEWILQDTEFKGKYNVVSCSSEPSDELNGFMAMILKCNVSLQAKGDPKSVTIPLIVKVMKGSRDFRARTKSFHQCSNEVLIYEKVIPYFKKFIKSRKSSIDPEQWTPKIYRSYYGKIPELSDMDESLLVMENISVSGFVNGPRKTLDLNHLLLMTAKIAQYHSVQFAMRIDNDEMLHQLKSQMTPLPWKDAAGAADNIFECLYRPAFQRLFEYLDRHPEMYISEKMTEEVGLLRKLFYNDPVSLLQHFAPDDKLFSVIQHGDYNRNNVLFKYSEGEPEKPVALRMIDFQETRYGSPAMDLFFFLYMSTTAELREASWDVLLHSYHGELWKCLKELLNCDDSDSRLEHYSFANLEKHFARFAFYGTMVTIQFLPWMVSDEEELDPLAQEFTKDMKSEKCKRILLAVGGDGANKKVVETLQHAVSRGYLSFIKDL